MMDFADVKGQEAAKRAVTIALAGDHSIALIGPAGHGKTMLANRAKSINPELTIREHTIRRRKFDADGNALEAPEPPADLAACDIHCEVPELPFRDLFSKRPGTDTATIRKCLEHAAYSDLSITSGCELLLKQAYHELGLTPRSVATIIDVARTIANMGGAPTIDESHVAEAVQYRLLDRKF